MVEEVNDKKRGLIEIDPGLLEGRFRGKADFYYYL